MKLLLALTPVAYIVLNMYVAKKINKAFYLKEKRRKLHEKIIWLIPFLGPLMLRGFWKKNRSTKLDVITKSNRKNKAGGFYESGLGVHPVEDP